MNVKRFISASLAVYIVSQALGYLVHGVLLAPVYEATKSVWRPDMQSKMWIEWVYGLTTAVLFTYIFTKGYEGRGVMEGVRFGLLVGLLVSIPMAYGTYMSIPIPYYLALQWFLYGTGVMVLMGVTAALVYRAEAARAAAA